MIAFRTRERPPTNPKYGCKRRDAYTYSPPERGISIDMIVYARTTGIPARAARSVACSRFAPLTNSRTMRNSP